MPIGSGTTPEISVNSPLIGDEPRSGFGIPIVTSRHLRYAAVSFRALL